MNQKTKKILSGIVLAIVLVVVVALVAFLVFTGTTIKHSIQVIGSQVTGCPITVENIDVSLLKGEITIDNFVVGNPDGFKSESAFSLTKVHLSLVPSSLLSNKIHIREIQIIEPHVTYELGLAKSNIGQLLDNVNRFVGDDNGDKPEASGGGKDLQVDHVLFEGGQIKMTAKLLGGHGVPVPLPGIELHDLGKDEPIKAIPLIATILKSMLTSVVNVAK